MIETERLLVPDEVCEYLQVKKSWLYDECQAGRMPHKKLGKFLRFRKSDLDRWLDEEPEK